VNAELLLDIQQVITHKRGTTCGRCANAIRPHHYRPDWIYCKKRISNRTQYGLLKVKSRREACEMFITTPSDAIKEAVK